MRAPGRRLVSLVFLTCLAAGVNLLEDLLLPVPRTLAWMRVGLANAVTLAALALFDLRAALVVVFARTLLASVARGSFLSFGYLLSVSGAVAGALVMWGIRRGTGALFSPVGQSAAGGFASSSVMFSIAWLLSPPAFRGALTSLLPVVLGFGLLGGIVTGFAARALLAALNGEAKADAVGERRIR
jgi:heptaprenyl diphosphate synthase